MSFRPGKIAIVVGMLMCAAPSADAAKGGLAELRLLDAITHQSEIHAAIGDTLSIEVMISAREELITGVNVFFTLADEVLQLVAQGTNAAGPVPFAQGTYIRGVAYENNTINDQVGELGIPGIQLHYFENAQAGPAGPVTGEGVLATFKVRVVGRSEGFGSIIQIDRLSPVGSETGYFIDGDPGATYSFRTATSIQLLAPVVTTAMADFNGDRVVNFDDFLSFAAAFGKENLDHDLDGSGLVDFQDFLEFAGRFGQSY